MKTLERQDSPKVPRKNQGDEMRVVPQPQIRDRESDRRIEPERRLDLQPDIYNV